MLLFASLVMLLTGAVQERALAVVSAPDSPVRLERATMLTASDGPPVVVYAATNLTGDPLEQFTIMAFVFRADGTLKARQVAPGRRSLEAKETKYSTLVLDGSPLEAGDVVIVGVNQAQRVNSDAWWRADLQPAAEERAHRKP